MLPQLGGQQYRFGPVEQTKPTFDPLTFPKHRPLTKDSVCPLALELRNRCTKRKKWNMLVNHTL